MKNWKHFTRLGLGLVMAVGFTSYLASCKKDDTSSGGNNNTTTTLVKPYVIIDGFKYQCARQSTLKVKLDQGDSLLTWIGTGTSDTQLYIRHTAKDIKVGKFTIDSSGFPDPGGVSVSIRWGTNLGSPNINIAKGDYELKKENGKYVSYLKNGEAFNGLDHKDRYYNIEFKVIWPY